MKIVFGFEPIFKYSHLHEQSRGQQCAQMWHGMEVLRSSVSDNDNDHSFSDLKGARACRKKASKVSS